jgi:hypothetical protein
MHNEEEQSYIDENGLKNEAFLNYCHTYDSNYNKSDKKKSIKELLIEVIFFLSN